jgi:hypothetical protein
VILVGRPAKIPRSLAKGVERTSADCAARDANPAAYESGAEKFVFLKSIYGPKSTKKQLATAQSSKCCFCEAVFDANVAGDVEHYRPKQAVTSGSSLIYPGYYWLAYRLENLFYSCPDCNQYKKKNKFPLRSEMHRARSHHDMTSAEQPLLLSPGGPTDPRQHIRFNFEVPVGLTEEGRTTIEVLGLDRYALNRDRRKYLRRLEGDLEIIRLLEDDPRPRAAELVVKASVTVADAVLPSSEFSAAAQDMIAGWRSR